MSNEMVIENATKATQAADLLLSDLQELNRNGSAADAFISANASLRFHSLLRLRLRYFQSKAR